MTADRDADRRRSISGHPRSAYQRVSASSISGHLRSNQRSSAFKGQAIVEYAILIGVVTAAIVGMQAYAKRGLQAGIKLMADQLGDQRNGVAEIDLGLDWKKKGNAKPRTTTHAPGKPTAPATRSVESKAGGVRVTHANEATTSSGTLSSEVFVARGQ
ncbi:MAG: hypothetical protein HYZ89_00285 [Candidatus Omnitrophica bacterium]|nr:hypothetical protein [Candidatus Omnitrophota bacterium]